MRIAEPSVSRAVRILASLLVCGMLSMGNALAEDGPASLRGRVQDSTGAPLIGALIAVQYEDAFFRERLVFSDRSGVFSVPNLLAGNYSLKVTKPRFLPAVAAGITLTEGTNAVLTISLQTAMEIIRRGIRRGSLEEMKWVLRSAPSTRPILRMVEDDTDEVEVDATVAALESSGYFQLYSKSINSPEGPTDSVGSQFAFSLPLALGSQVTFTGQYTEASNQPRGFGATYEFSPGENHKSFLAVNMRQGALFNAGQAGAATREVKVQYGEQLQWSDHLVFTYGADIGRADGITSNNYLRPELGAAWVPEARTTLKVLYSRRAPADTDDPIRGREYFDRTVYIPPELESYSHSEIGATHILSEFLRVSAAAFRDEAGTQAFLVDAENGRRAIMMFDGDAATTTGVRMHADRSFRGFEAGVGYTYASARGFDQDVVSPEELRRDAVRRNFHVVTARVKTDIDLTQTAVTAVYRWNSGFSLAAVDPYQRFAEYNDPTLSITIAQDLPSWKIFPGRFQAVVDARNLFEPSFGSRRTIHAQYPRLLKGGIHIKF